MIDVHRNGKFFTKILSPAHIFSVANYDEIFTELMLEKESLALWAESEAYTVHANLLRTATGNASIEERDTWQAKALSAAAHRASTATEAQTAGLQAEAGAMGETIDELAALINAKAESYNVLIGTVAGLHRSAINRFKKAETADEVLAELETYKAAAAAILV